MPITVEARRAASAGREYSDALHPAKGLFALGRPFGQLPTSTDSCDPEALPFGLRLAVPSGTVPVGDLADYGYDHYQQIGTVRRGGRVLPLQKHTTGQTRTTTNPDGHGGPDSDADHRED